MVELWTWHCVFGKKYETTIDAYCFGQTFVLLACFKKVQLSWSFTSLELAKSMQQGMLFIMFCFFPNSSPFCISPLNLKKSYPFFMAKDEQLHLKFRRKACILVIVFTRKASNCLTIKPYYIFYKGNMKMYKLWLNIFW